MKNYIIIALVAIIAAPTAYGVGKTIEARVEALEQQIIELEVRIKLLEPKPVIQPKEPIKPKIVPPAVKCNNRRCPAQA